MKILICLFATFCLTNATFLSLLGGKGSGGGSGGSGGGGGLFGGGGGRTFTYEIVSGSGHGSGHGGAHGVSHGHVSSGGYSHGHGHGVSGGYAQGHGYSHGGHGDSVSPQVIKLILEQGQGYSNHGGNYASGHSYSHGASTHGVAYGGGAHGGAYGGSHGGSHGGNTQIYKVIQENAAAGHGYGHGHASAIHYGDAKSAGYSYGQSYGSGHSHSSGGGYGSQINAILPQILQIIMQDEMSGSASDGAYNAQLIDAFGHYGKATIMRSSGAQGTHFTGGNIIQKGHLEVKRVQDNSHARTSGGIGGGGGGGGGAQGGGLGFGLGQLFGLGKGGGNGGGHNNAGSSTIVAATPIHSHGSGWQ